MGGVGFGDLYGAIERGLNGFFFGVSRNGPAYGDAGEGFGNEEAVP